MQTDVKSAIVAFTGTVFNGRTRLRGVLVTPGSSAGSVQITDGTNVLLQFTTLASGTPFSILIPGEGILCQTSLSATVSSVILNVFYG